MANIKTAISIEKELFDELAIIAAEKHFSRSRLFSLAMRDFIKKYKSQELLARLNEAYQDVPDKSEESLYTHMKAKHNSLVKDQW